MNSDNENNIIYDFKYCSFLTYYTCKCDSVGINKTGKSEDVCFSSVFRYAKNDAKYNIYVCRDPAILLINRSNYCLLNIDEINTWLNYICTFVDSEYSIDDDVIKLKNGHNYPCYKINFHIKSGSNMYHRFVMTLIRYLYEFPFNTMLKDVFKLKDLQEFENEELINIHNIVMSTFDSTNLSGPHGHSLTGASKLLTKEELINKLNENNNLNDMFTTPRCYQFFKTLKTIYLLNFWEDNKIFESLRLPAYLNNYKLLLKERNNDLKSK